jgi:hypothetical protein
MISKSSQRLTSLGLEGNLVKFPGLDGDLTDYLNRESRPRGFGFELIPGGDFGFMKGARCKVQGTRQ